MREGRSTLDAYLDDTSAFHLLDAQTERARLDAIACLRRARWRALLCGPAATMLPDLAEPRSEEKGDAPRLPSAAVELLRRCWAARGRVLEPADADAIDALDLDGFLADRLTAHLAGVTIDGEVPEAVRLGAELRTARNDFACRNLRLVVGLAARYHDERMSLTDRVQEGNLGLLTAIGRFDPSLGHRFSTYAAWWIRYSIARALVNRGRCVRVPAHVHGTHSTVRRVEHALRSSLGREPSIDEIAQAAGVGVEKVLEARLAMSTRVVPIDAPDGDSEIFTPPPLACAPDDSCDDELDDRRNLAIARVALADLEPMERDIIERRFGLDGEAHVTLTTLGRHYALSRERIRQLQARALGKLRSAIERHPLGTLACDRGGRPSSDVLTRHTERVGP